MQKSTNTKSSRRSQPASTNSGVFHFGEEWSEALDTAQPLPIPETTRSQFGAVSEQSSSTFMFNTGMGHAQPTFNFASYSGPSWTYAQPKSESSSSNDILVSTRERGKVHGPSQHYDTVKPFPQPEDQASVPEPHAKSNATSYDVRSESPPSHPFFGELFQSQIRAGKIISQQITELFEDSSFWSEHSSVTKLVDDARRLSAFHVRDTRTIAVMGDSGEGKSSLINSLLHCPGIAKTGDVGSACTSVVTEYRLKEPQHMAPITLEVEYMSKYEMEEVLSELLWSYRLLYLPNVQSNKTSTKVYERYTRESAQAWSALEAAFKHKSEFNESFLLDMSDGAIDRIESQLITWSREIEWPAGGANGIWRSTAVTPRECCEKTDIFMSNRYWPFTKIIRVYLESRVLETGLVLADLPGLKYMNLARIRSTQDYLMKCSNIFVVTKISRAVTDQSLKSSLYSILPHRAREGSAAKSLSIAIDINEESARYEFGRIKKGIECSILERLDKDIEKAKAHGNKELKKELKGSRELLFIEARNNHVKDGLQAAYSSKVPGSKLDFFFVSNKMYEKYSKKENNQFTEASGIPGLRKFCLQITADAQLREAKDFLQSSLFNLVTSFEVCLNSLASSSNDNVALIKSKKLAHDAISATERLSSAAVTNVQTDFMACFDDQIMKLSDNRHAEWMFAAENELSKWETWHWSQFNAWCLHDGNHETDGRGREDWNAKIIWKMRSELEYQWELLEQERSEVFSTLLGTVSTLLVSLKGTIQNLAPVRVQTLLADVIYSHIRGLEYTLRLSEENFDREIGLVRRSASETNSTSIILNEMIPAYRVASYQGTTGEGAALRQKAVINNRITDGVLFPNMVNTISTRVSHVVDKIVKDLEGHIGCMMEAIKKDIHPVFASTANSSILQCPIHQTLMKVKDLRRQAEAIHSKVDGM
ncbi:unnamed protein product [Clonostachys byssicola]|uniref:Uncharacterized protein n=1 Tax=Clonostachys byssicola TaxID=160290 RepID=A0A9N9U411_9HYPO|nr:unnamed protein product [Clonostachys byssicola]